MPKAFRLTPREPTEAQIQGAVLQYLAMHPRIAWARRINTGAHAIEGPGGRRFVRYGFKGCSDILGMLADGRLLAVECKTRKGRPTPEQVEFLQLVADNGGVAVLARGIDDVEAALGPPVPR